MINDEYLIRHNIKSISQISDGETLPKITIKYNNGNEISFLNDKQIINIDNLYDLIDYNVKEEELKLLKMMRRNKILKIIYNKK